MTTTTRDRAWDSYYIDAWRIGHQWGLRQHVSSPRYIFFLLTLFAENNYTTIASATTPATVSPNRRNETMRNRAWDVYGVPVLGPMFVLFFLQRWQQRTGHISWLIYISHSSCIILYINIDGCSFFHFFVYLWLLLNVSFSSLIIFFTFHTYGYF